MATLARNSLYNPKLENPYRDEHRGLGRPSGRVLALDVGKKRIGLAVSDELGITAQGLETLQRTRIRVDLEKLKEIAHQWNVGCLLVGKPLHMSGSESRQSEYTTEFAERVGRYLELPVVFLDERLTSVEAERVLRQAGASLDERKHAVDRLSAVLLLESYLAQHSTLRYSEDGGTVG
jgi:putative holliday junction resolvase